MTIWKEYKLGEIAEIKNGKARPKSSGSIPVYGGNGILDYADDYNVAGDTTVIGRVGAYCGAVYFENNKIWVSDNALFAKSKREFDSKYLYYLLKNDNLNQYAGGSSHPLLTQGRLNDLKYTLPDLPTQTAIAEILSSLDDKIELNNKINAELEALAQTLFKQWFIDFEFPNANGQPYRSSGGKMVDSELGEIPEGWEVGVLDDFGGIVCGKTPSKKKQEYYGNDMPFIKIPDMHNKTYIVESVDNLSIKGYQSQGNKTLPKNTIIVSSIATVGLVSMTSRPSQTNQQINAIIPYKEWVTFFVYNSCKNLTDTFIQLASGGSATLNMNTSTFKNIPIIIPDESKLKQYHKAVTDIFGQLEQNLHENQELTRLRDTLLPKLISGKIEVTDLVAEKA